ncbi:hypothetical protein [Bacillus cytotoxicus]|uniref:hypothetical protein n=1 Tax=Bacillus cytotoxicus TaxID=580165 RepID=UPI000863CBDB|nr:hypothetical protein [Bacillus cytotoxicus]AWC28252.1 hypothetical protein CG483_007630 [Bacillus cytotoxicus]AWC40363.1 hypothetical protein CG480_007620 [Bacillus cytotoxicus]AWC48294.1 hypothetical protein CG478_007620 [Bacillus cytotoxicus]AWC52318.1 hypothetical protein CG477_007590 [Bacillus cytotoxicus]AWC56453.1 hypothetical protein CG476_007620 [Bacillus cytotoxicus]
MRLEYRLNSKEEQYPALWNYINIPVSEVIARMTCEYFVKEGDTYVVTATAMDHDKTAVLYVQKEDFLNDPLDHTYSHIGFEIRELQGTDSILLESKEVWNHEDILSILHSDIIYIQKDEQFIEFTLDSREIDEDRKCYVYYGTFNNEHR